MLAITIWVLLPNGTPLWGICRCCVQVSRRKCCLLPQLMEERGSVTLANVKGPCSHRNGLSAPKFLKRIQWLKTWMNCQSVSQVSKHLWTPEGLGAEQPRKPLGSGYKILLAEESLGSALVIRYGLCLSCFTQFVAGSAEDWMACCPSDLVQAAFSKIILDSLEAWEEWHSLVSGLLPWSIHGSARMSVLVHMCLHRSLFGQRTSSCARTHRLACSHAITKTWSAALVGIWTVHRWEADALEHGLQCAKDPSGPTAFLTKSKDWRQCPLGMPQYRGINQMLAETLNYIWEKWVLSGCLGYVLHTTSCLTFLLLPLATRLVSVKDLRREIPGLPRDLREMSSTCSL